MEWTLIGVLVVALGVSISLYRRGLAECRGLQSFIILILLNDGVYQAQRNGLIELVRGIKAANAMDLSPRVIISLGRLAHQLATAPDSSILGAHAALWHLKQQLDKT